MNRKIRMYFSRLTLMMAAVLLLGTFLSCLMPARVSAAQPNVVDNADILTDEEEASLQASIDSIKAAHNFEPVILTMQTVGSESNAEAVADDYFDYHGYGMGEDRSGALILMSMDERYMHISGRGSGTIIYNEERIASAFDVLRSSMSAGNYYAGFDAFLSVTDQYCRAYENGDYDYHKNYAMRELIAVAIAAVITLIVVFYFKSQLSNVAHATKANAYVKNGGMNITGYRDIYLYSTMHRVKRESSSGGGGTHTSSSGASHSGGGSHF